MAKVYFFEEPRKVAAALDLCRVSDFTGKKVPVKLHMGEAGNTTSISTSFVKLLVEKLKSVGAKPFLFDTTACRGGEATRQGYETVAQRRSFGQVGCEAIVGDAGVPVIEGGIEFDVVRQIHNASHLVVLSHVQGDPGAGFSGAIKNLGMGGVTWGCKRRLHDMSQPKYLEEKCNLCGKCAKVCPSQAITINDTWNFNASRCQSCGMCISACHQVRRALIHQRMNLQEGIVLSAKACSTGKKVIYLNALINITSSSDCEPNPRPTLCPDIGYLASTEMVAVDKASLDLIDRVKPSLFEATTRVNPLKQIYCAEEMGYDSSYTLEYI